MLLDGGVDVQRKERSSTLPPAEKPVEHVWFPDEKNTPPAAAENPEKKSLFGWLRKKPQDEPAAVQAASETPTPPESTVAQAATAPEVAAKVTVELRQAYLRLRQRRLWMPLSYRSKPSASLLLGNRLPKR